MANDECAQDENELTCLREQNAELKKEVATTPSACEVGAALGGTAGTVGFLLGPTGFLTTTAGVGVGCMLGLGYEAVRNNTISYIGDATDGISEGFCNTAPQFCSADKSRGR